MKSFVQFSCALHWITRFSFRHLLLLQDCFVLFCARVIEYVFVGNKPQQRLIFWEGLPKTTHLCMRVCHASVGDARHEYSFFMEIAVWPQLCGFRIRKQTGHKTLSNISFGSLPCPFVTVIYGMFSRLSGSRGQHCRSALSASRLSGYSTPAEVAVFVKFCLGDRKLDNNDGGRATQTDVVAFSCAAQICALQEDLCSKVRLFGDM